MCPCRPTTQQTLVNVHPPAESVLNGANSDLDGTSRGPLARLLSLKPHKTSVPLWAWDSACLSRESLSFCSSSRAAVEFLRKLASLSGGRYHCPVSDDTLSGIQGLLTRGFIEEKVGHPPVINVSLMEPPQVLASFDLRVLLLLEHTMLSKKDVFPVAIPLGQPPLKVETDWRRYGYVRPASAC